jgi:hypothetical protein
VITYEEPREEHGLWTIKTKTGNYMYMELATCRW